jgi:hypothetical protein
VTNFTVNTSTVKWSSDGSKITSGDSIFYYIHGAVVGKDEMTETAENSFSYPNPNNGKFTFESRYPFNFIEIYNLQGLKIYTSRKALKQTSCFIRLQDPFKGICFMKIHTDDKIQTKKVMVY